MCLGLASGYIKNNANKSSNQKEFIGFIYKSNEPSEIKTAHVFAKDKWDALRQLQYVFIAPLYHIVRVEEL